MKQLLLQLDPQKPSPQRLHAVRVTAILEYNGTPEARRILESLAKGVPEAHLTREAKAALERLTRQPPGQSEDTPSKSNRNH